MSTDPVIIGAAGIDTAQVVADIRARVAERMQAGYYSDPRIARAERHNLRHMASEDEFLEFYLDCLREAVLIDINDYEIRERRRLFAPLLIAFKRAVWQALKFYTYRLWSQQNQVNTLLLSATEEIDRKYRERIQKLEARVKDLEKTRAC
jgi:hypothetical protein